MGTRGHAWAHVGTHGHAWARMDFQLCSECGRRWALQANSAACGVNRCQAGARTSVPGVCVCVFGAGGGAPPSAPRSGIDMWRAPAGREERL
eukprot:968877-Prymnesium_polylepis.1